MNGIVRVNNFESGRQTHARPKLRKAVSSAPCPACGSPAFADSRYVRNGFRYCSSACLRMAGGGQ